ncbi:hypothetical protein CONPUDRAFT_68745 [Coniophora puteana RWD-64-598 SS2]|uniref:Uncharacterized protein n=1 Tax=Coniophora puteana (strain RWD-64-598) TaxID=741705 RepID=A0A5M3N510_CONPW|nr:uncharacterized protein CONPUDRAFT_68745 [Coniophora puteana RWD-64-598 SS2]EIW86144.1 hypothetical protein CONPUDRAFT_68745 [Coniophora puteana RWD-64-598 SS2]
MSAPQENLPHTNSQYMQDGARRQSRQEFNNIQLPPFRYSGYPADVSSYQNNLTPSYPAYPPQSPPYVSQTPSYYPATPSYYPQTPSYQEYTGTMHYNNAGVSPYMPLYRSSSPSSQYIPSGLLASPRLPPSPRLHQGRDNSPVIPAQAPYGNLATEVVLTPPASSGSSPPAKGDVDVEGLAREAAMAACDFTMPPLDDLDEDTDDDDTDDDDDDEEDELDTSHITASDESWKVRNPNRPVIPSRPAAAPLTAEQKAQRSARRKQKAERDEALRKEILKLIISDEVIQRLSRQFDVPIRTIENMIFRAQERKHRTVRLYNAKLHYERAHIIYPDNLTPPQKTKFLHAYVKAKTYTREQEIQMVQELEDDRERRRNAVRCSNRAANQDVIHTTNRIIALLDALRTRTGIYACVMIVRGHINDPMQPVLYGTDNSSEFFHHSFDKTPDQMIRMFEQWACNLAENLDQREKRDKLSVHQEYCVASIEAQLRLGFMTGQNTRMNYKNYQKKIVQTHGITLEGWPEDITMKRPHLITQVGDIKRIREALESRKCFWQSLDGKRNSKGFDAAAPVKRKMQQKKQSAPRKKKATGGKAAGPKSAEIIEASDEE